MALGTGIEASSARDDRQMQGPVPGSGKPMHQTMVLLEKYPVREMEMSGFALRIEVDVMGEYAA